jgi:hypothetical protein
MSQLPGLWPPSPTTPLSGHPVSSLFPLHFLVLEVKCWSRAFLLLSNQQGRAESSWGKSTEAYILTFPEGGGRRSTLVNSKALSRTCSKHIVYSRVLVAQICHPSYLGSRDQDNYSLKPVWANSSWDPILKLPNAKRTGGIAQGVQCLPNKHKAWIPPKTHTHRHRHTHTYTHTQTCILYASMKYA